MQKQSVHTYVHMHTCKTWSFLHSAFILTAKLGLHNLILCHVNNNTAHQKQEYPHKLKNKTRETQQIYRMRGHPF